jgi:aspartyl-tRNA(Asn)/glutamyl-tRNA(Gln) amidotransferase subunit C
MRSRCGLAIASLTVSSPDQPAETNAEAASAHRISTADVVKVAKLARLELTPAEIERMTEQLDGMLLHFADMDALNLEQVHPMTQPYPLSNVFREDVVLDGLDHDEVMAAAPMAESGRFRVPPIIGLDS